MSQIGNVQEINVIKNQLAEMTEKGLVKEWEIPYENILTRLTAAIIFLTPTEDSKLQNIWKALGENKLFTYRPNEEKTLSQLAWKVEFNKGFEL